MKVLHVSDFFPPVRGGLEGHVDDLAAAQADQGHEVHVATITEQPLPGHPDVSAHVIATAAQSMLRYRDAARPFALPLPDPRARRGLGLLLQELRPDVVHAHGWLGASVPRSAKVPLVLTAHDYALVCHLRTLVRRDGGACAGPSGRDCLRCAGRSVRGGLLATSTAVGRRRWRFDAVITLSEHVARTLQPFVDVPIEVCGGLLPRRDVEVDVDAVGLPAGPFVLFAGDDGAHKGLDVLLDAWRELPDATLVVATTRPLERRLPAGVVGTSLPRAAMPAAWRRASLAVVPSVWSEPFGMVAMEALAAGTPVVASRVGGLPEIVRDGVDGVLVDPGDPRSLAAAIRALLADDARRAAMATAARAGATRFAPEHVAGAVVDVYGSVL
jgi:glycosyltransferase involved in cell wall biosynthesis